MLRDYIGLPRQVHILCLGSFVNRAGSFVLIFLTIYVSKQLGFGIGFATTCMGVFGFGSMVASLIGGQLADQIGRRIVMLVALFGGAAMLVVLSLARDRWVFLTAIAVFALVNEMYRPAASAMIGDLVTPAQRGHAFGLMYVAINLGFACGPPLGGFLAERSFDLLFWGDAITTAVYGVIILACIRETRPRSSALRSSEATGTVGDEGPPRDVPLLEAFDRIRADWTFLAFCFSSLLSALVFMQLMSTLPIHIVNSGYSNAEFGWLMSINGILIVTCQLPATHLLSRFNRMGVILTGGLLIAAGFGLTYFAHTGAMLALTIVVWTSGEIMQAPFKHAVVTDLAPADLRARYLGLFSMCYSSALTIGAPIGGAIMQRYGAGTLWITCACVALVAVAMYIAIYQPITRRHERISSPPPDRAVPPEADSSASQRAVTV